MMMILQSVGCGLAFAFGAAVGVGISCSLISSGHKKNQAEIKAQNDRIEKRLSIQVEMLERIATCMERKELSN